jgi:hypothetical protein
VEGTAQPYEQRIANVEHQEVWRRSAMKEAGILVRLADRTTEQQSVRTAHRVLRFQKEVIVADEVCDTWAVLPSGFTQQWVARTGPLP